MNSWKSRSFEACLPPLIRFTSGTGRTCALAFRCAVQRRPGHAAPRPRGGERDAEDRVRAEPRLVRRAVELDQRRVELALLGERTADERVARARRSRVRPRPRTPKPPKRSPPSRSSAASLEPVERPDGTSAVPTIRPVELDVDLHGRAGRGSRAPRGARDGRVTSRSLTGSPSPSSRIGLGSATSLRLLRGVGEVRAEQARRRAAGRRRRSRRAAPRARRRPAAELLVVRALAGPCRAAISDCTPA